MQWTDEATELFAELVAFLPTSLRHTVAEQAETCAELFADEVGRHEVVSELAFVALMECTPLNLRARRRVIRNRNTCAITTAQLASRRRKDHAADQEE